MKVYRIYIIRHYSITGRGVEGVGGDRRRWVPYEYYIPFLVTHGG